MNHTLKDEERCSRLIRRADGVTRCRRRGVVTVNGKLWCKVHDPIESVRAEQERNLRWSARWRAKSILGVASASKARAERMLIECALEQAKAEVELHDRLGTPIPDSPLIVAAREVELWRKRVEERQLTLKEANEAVRTHGRIRKET